MEIGLRERKKAATRAALSRAAVRLALERGVEGVTIEAIAEEADVSARTFHNYFPGKEEAIVAPLFEGARAAIDDLRGRPADEPIWDSLRHVLLHVLLPSRSHDERVALLRVVAAEPALVARQLLEFKEMEREIATVIAARTGTDVERDLYPHLMAEAAGAAMRAAVEFWMKGGTDADLNALVHEAFDRLRAGLPGP